MFHYPFMMNNFFMPAFMPRFMPMFMPSFMPTFMPAFMPTFMPTIFTGFMQPFVPQQSIFTCQQNSVPANSTKRARRKQRKNEPLAEVKQKIQVTETSSAAQKPENRIQTTKKAENTTNQTSQTTVEKPENTTNQTSQTTVEKPENTTSVAPPSNTTSIQTQTSETAPAESSKVTTDKVKKNLGKKAAKEINCNYKDLLALLNSESSLNPKAINNRTKAAGLLQFMPSTAKDLGTSTEEILNMSVTEQLVYVVKYFKIHKKIAGFKPNARLDAADLYALTFLPGRSKREILTDSSEKYYKHNKGLDLDRDGKITKTELAARINQKRVNESIFS